MATHSSTLAWKIPSMEGPGRLQSMGSLGVGYDLGTSLSLFTFMHWRRKWQPTPVFLPRESQGRGAWWAAIYGVEQSQIRLKRLSSNSSSSLSCGTWDLFIVACRGDDSGEGGHEKDSLQTAEWQNEDTGLLGNIQEFIHLGHFHCLTVPSPVLCPGQGRDPPEVNQIVLGWLNVA